jgi:hypothetical protein
MKKSFLLVALATVTILGAKAQANLQMFYDLGRGHQTTTLEMFKGDDWGNTFFFCDYDYNLRDINNKVYAPSGTYFELARCWNFWQESSLGAFSLQMEYNGGFGIYNFFAGPVENIGGFAINNAFLLGVDYFLHSADFNNTLNLKVLYKDYIHCDQKLPLQFTAVWGMQNLFGVTGLRFSGFADFWWQHQAPKGTPVGEATEFVFLSEPQLWYKVGQHFGCPNLNIGGEVELGYNFVDYGFACYPCLGLKWDF